MDHSYNDVRIEGGMAGLGGAATNDAMDYDGYVNHDLAFDERLAIEIEAKEDQRRRSSARNSSVIQGCYNHHR